MDNTRSSVLYMFPDTHTHRPPLKKQKDRKLPSTTEGSGEKMVEGREEGGKGEEVTCLLLGGNGEFITGD